MNEADTLKVFKEVLERAAYLELATPDPWKVIIMALSVLVFFSIEPVIIFLLVRYPDFREWSKRCFENSDGQPNTEDLRNFLAYYIGILHTGRVIMIASLFMIFFGANLIELIMVMGGVMISIITGNVIIGRIAFNRK
jgi:hypothetical protein